MTPSPPKKDATSDDIVNYVQELHACVDRHAKRANIINIASMCAILAVLLTVLGGIYKTSAWTGRVDARLDAFSAALSDHGDQFKRIDSELNIIMAALFGKSR